MACAMPRTRSKPSLRRAWPANSRSPQEREEVSNSWAVHHDELLIAASRGGCVGIAGAEEGWRKTYEREAIEEPLRLATEEVLRSRSWETERHHWSYVEEAERILETELLERRAARRSPAAALRRLDRPIARLREAASTFSEVALRAEVREVARDLACLQATVFACVGLPEASNMFVECTLDSRHDTPDGVGANESNPESHIPAEACSAHWPGGASESPRATVRATIPIPEQEDAELESSATALGATVSLAESALSSTMSLAAPRADPQELDMSLESPRAALECRVASEQVHAVVASPRAPLLLPTPMAAHESAPEQADVAMQSPRAALELPVSLAAPGATAAILESPRASLKSHGTNMHMENRDLVTSRMPLVSSRAVLDSPRSALQVPIVWSDRNDDASGFPHPLCSTQGIVTASESHCHDAKETPVSIWRDLATPSKPDRCLATLQGHGAIVRCVAASDKDLIASGSYDSTIKIWGPRSNVCHLTLAGHSDTIWGVVFLSKNILASCSLDRTVKLWNCSTGKCLSTLEGHIGAVYTVAALGPAKLASGSFDGTVKIWDVTDEKCLATLRGHRGPVISLAVLDQQCFSSGSHDCSVKLWNALTGQCQATLKGHSGPVWSIIMPKDRTLVSGSHDHTLKVWDTIKRMCLATLVGHAGPVLSLASLGSGRAASGSSDNVVRLWNIVDAYCFATLQGHDGPVWSVAELSSNCLATGSCDGVIRVWDVANYPEGAECEGIEHTAYSQHSVVGA